MLPTPISMPPVTIINSMKLIVFYIKPYSIIVNR